MSQDLAQSTQSTEERRRVTLAAQEAAADPRQSVWVSANAGTGKTRVLTDRVIRLLLQGTPPEKILCLTFTKTAAAEMANRLFERLGRWTALDDLTLLKELQALEGVDIEAERLAPARRLFAGALETPGGLKIQTIHAFCQSVLERFPLEAGVTPGAQVLDDAGARALLRNAEMLLYGQASGDVKEALSRLAVRYDVMGFSDLLRQVLGMRAKIRDVVEAVGGLDLLEADLLQHLDLPEGASLEGTLRGAVEEIARLEPELRAVAADLAGGTKTDVKRSDAILSYLAQPDHESAYGAYSGVYLKKDGEPFVKLMTKKLGETCPGTLDFLTREQGRVQSVEHQMRKLRGVRLTVDLIKVADAFIQNYTALKVRRGALDYDDLIAKTADLLSTTAAVSWVHYKLDGGIEQILVDEAQDTSPGQWAVIGALAEEFFSGTSAFDEDPKRPRTIFVVGDEKQSIYSFQGADLKVFAAMHASFEKRVKDAGKHFADLDLILSFRSTTEVLKAVDSVFEDPPAAKGLTTADTPLIHEADRVAAPGLVELWPTVRPEDTDEINPWDAPLDAEPRAAPRAVVANRIAAQIGHWIDTGEPVLPGGKPVEAGDILILVQRRNSFVDEMIRALKLRKIPVAGRDRMVLTDQMAVMDLMALASFALLPEDDLTLASVLRSPLASVSEDDLFDLAHGRSGTLWSALSARRGEPRYAAAFAELSQVLARVDVLRPFEFFVEALSASTVFDTSGRERLLSRLGPEAGDPIDEFLSRALAFEQLEAPSLQGFLAYISGDQAEIKRDFDHEPREVRIMTVHGAKGLEGRIVFLPDTCTTPTARSDAPLVTFGDEGDERLFFGLPKAEADEAINDVRAGLREKRLEEQRRLLYVAMTRARDALFITGYETKNKRSQGSWYDLAEAALAPLMKPAAGFDGAEVLRLQLDHVPGTEEDKEEEPRAARTEAGPPPAWIHVAVVAEPPPLRFAPSGLGAVFEDEDGFRDMEPPSFSPLVSAHQDRFKRGLAVHRLLELLPDVAGAQRRDAAVSFLRDPGRGFAPGAAEAIATEVMAVLDHPDFVAIFGPGSLAEAPVAGLLPGTGIALNGSVDRLLVSADEVLIVDFKTNRPPPLDIKDLSSLYVTQMAAYRALLSVVAPGRPVRAALIWTDGARLMEVPPRLMDAAIARLKDKI